MKKTYTRYLILAIVVHFAITILFYILRIGFHFQEVSILPGFHSPMICFESIATLPDGSSDLLFAILAVPIFMVPIAATVTALVSLFGKTKLSYLIACVCDMLVRMLVMLAIEDYSAAWYDYIGFGLNLGMIVAMFALHVAVEKENAMLDAQRAQQSIATEDYTNEDSIISL